MSKTSVLFLFLALLSMFSVIESQSDKTGKDSCNSKITCSACIQTQKCAWCSQLDIGDKPRCFQYDLQSTMKCKKDKIEFPINVQKPIEENKLSLSSRKGKLVQISPQKIDLKLRISKFDATLDYFFNDLAFQMKNTKCL